jgi:uncharacterized membrane protein
MSWALAGNWLAVLGLVFLTLGTAAQAWASLSEFEHLRETVSKAAADPLAVSGSLAGITASVPVGILMWRSKPERLSVLKVPLLLFPRPRQLARIHAKGGDEAVRLAQLLRQVEVWGVIMIGSALGLAAAAIQLALSYH